MRRFALTVGLVLGLAALLVAAPSLALFMAPAAMLLLLLVNGRMPGEDTITRLRERVSVRTTKRPVALHAPRPLMIQRRTGQRITFALAVRPPPARPFIQH